MVNGASDQLCIAGRFSSKRALPNIEHAPAIGHQRLRLSGITRPVGFELLLPKGAATLRDRRAVAAMGVPVAPMDEHDGAKARKHEIGTARKRAVVKTKSQANGVKSRAQHLFYTGVFWPTLVIIFDRVCLSTVSISDLHDDIGGHQRFEVPVEKRRSSRERFPPRTRSSCPPKKNMQAVGRAAFILPNASNDRLPPRALLASSSMEIFTSLSAARARAFMIAATSKPRNSS